MSSFSLIHCVSTGFTLLFCVIGFTAAAQDTLQVEGPLRAGKYAGTANFAYTLDRGDTIISGPFTLQGGDGFKVVEGAANSFQFSGNYDAGTPSGPWQFSFGRFTPAGEGKVVDYQYSVALEGEELTARGNLSKGKPAGNWKQEIRRIEPGGSGEKVFQSEAEFTNGLPTGTFGVSDESDEILGRFNRAGLAHDDWDVYEQFEPQAIWRFRNGRLESIELTSTGDTLSVAVFNEPFVQSVTIDLDENYLNLLVDWLSMNGREEVITEGPVTDLLSESARIYRLLGEATESLGMVDFQPRFAVTVPQFPLTRLERGSLQTVANRLESIDSIAGQLNHANSLSIIGRRDPEVTYATAVAAELTGTFLAPVRRLVAAYRAERLEHLPRNRYVPALWDTTDVSGTLQINVPGSGGGSSRTFEGPDARTFNVGSGDLAEVVSLTEYAQASINSLRNVLNNKLGTRERRLVVAALEDELAYEYTRLDSLINTHGKKDIRNLQLESIRELAGRQLAAYRSTEDVMAKRERGQELVGCMRDLEALTLAVTDLPRRSDDIKNLYTDRVWNNNLAVLMSERVKKRVVDAYTEVLVPHFIAQIPGARTCGSARNLREQIQAADRRMVELRQADTDELESRLKGLDDPRAILNVLSVPSIQ